MGEETGRVRRDIYIETGTDEGGIDPDLDSGLDPVDAERREIERTRAQMGGTIDEIQERLTPGYIADQARSSVVDMADGLRTRVQTSVRENPIPAMITAAGLGYLLFRAFSSNGNGHSNGNGYSTPVEGDYAYGSYGPSGTYGSTEPGGSPVAGMKSKIDDMTGTAASKVEDAKTAVSQTAQAGMAQAQEMARTAGERTSRTADTVKRAISDNPAAAVVVALGVGAAAGMALPKTQVEDRYLGSAGEEVVDRAGEMVDQVGHKAKRAAERAGDAARQEMQQGS
jgi:ElaB/YqjD/DUF883 family membrane-anchored ribosome-binding protein